MGHPEGKGPRHCQGARPRHLILGKEAEPFKGDNDAYARWKLQNMPTLACISKVCPPRYSWKVGVESTDLTLASAASSGTLACVATGSTRWLVRKQELQRECLPDWCAFTDAVDKSRQCVRPARGHQQNPDQALQDGQNQGQQCGQVWSILKQAGSTMSLAASAGSVCSSQGPLAQPAT